MIAAWLAALRREEKWATAMLSERLPAIRRASIVLCLLATLVICASAQKNPTTVQAQKRRIVIGASMLLDGRGHVLRGPRILTAVEPLEGRGEKTGTPDEIRTFVRKQKEAGADLIKIFASASIRQGGGMTLSQDQLNAACDEANKQRLRTLVHAYKDAVRAATIAGCTEVEHGTMATEEDLKLMAERGTYLDPQAGLVIENYLANKERFLGTPGYTEEGFAAMERVLSIDHDLVRRAVKIPGLKVVFGTDALAGAHGRNAEELIDLVRDAGVDPMSALVSANSLAAEAMRMGERIGSMAPGYEADIIALDGDPLKDITAVRRVTFVMRGGIVYKNLARGAIPTYAGAQP